MPVFHPEFEPYCDEYARRLAESKADRYLVGHFSDNELPNPADSLDRFLNLDASTESLRSSRDAAAAWFQRRKGESANASDITEDDRAAFREYVYDRYLQVTNAAIRRMIRRYTQIFVPGSAVVGEIDSRPGSAARVRQASGRDRGEHLPPVGAGGGDAGDVAERSGPSHTW